MSDTYESVEDVKADMDWRRKNAATEHFWVIFDMIYENAEEYYERYQKTKGDTHD